MHLIWGIVGAVLGFSAGMLAYLALYRAFPDQFGRVPTLALVVIFALGGGGMMGGGWIALYLAARHTGIKPAKNATSLGQNGANSSSAQSTGGDQL